MKKYDVNLYFEVLLWFDDPERDDSRTLFFPSESQMFKYLHYWLINADFGDHFSIQVREYENPEDNDVIH